MVVICLISCSNWSIKFTSIHLIFTVISILIICVLQSLVDNAALVGEQNMNSHIWIKLIFCLCLYLSQFHSFSIISFFGWHTKCWELVNRNCWVTMDFTAIFFFFLKIFSWVVYYLSHSPTPQVGRVAHASIGYCIIQFASFKAS